MKFGDAIRRTVLEQSKRAHVGHIGSALSIADIIAALYESVLNLPSPDDANRDRFILSKGHAALALYAALQLKKIITEDELNSFCEDGSLLGVHPDYALSGVDFSTGSLGHGLSIGAGAAMAARMQQSDRRVFVLVSDAECNEGALWEAVMFAAHHKLSNLTVIVDCNGQQALGFTRDVIDLSPFAEKWRTFGWRVSEIDGHDGDQIVRAMDSVSLDTTQPHAIICNTVFGKGVSYMESTIKWHYWPMSDDEYDQAIAEIDHVS